MAGILEQLKRNVSELLHPQRREESQELQYLREVYYNREGNLRPKQWYRLSGESGNCVGFSYFCSCGQEYRLLSAWEWFKDFHCPQCKDKFDLLKFVGIDPKVTPVNQWKSVVESKLPARPGAVTGKQTPGAMQMGDWGGSAVNAPDEFWNGKPPLGSDGRWT
jgi:hypothetical protein